MIKSFLKIFNVRNTQNIGMKIILLPIYGIVLILDKVLNLKIYIENFEEASIPKQIKFNEYEKFILIETNDVHYLRNKTKIFVSRHKSLGEIKVSKSVTNTKRTIFKITGDTEFNTFNKFIEHLHYKTPRGRNFNIKAILNHKYDDKSSYFLFWDQCEMMLKGKTYNNKKIFVKTEIEANSEDVIYYNYMINYVNKFRFNKFREEIRNLRFDEFPI